MTETTHTYPACILKPMQLGKPGHGEEWFDYTSLGISEEHIPNLHPIIEDLTQRLGRCADNDGDYNGFLIIGLEKLNAKKALPVIAAAYAGDRVDLMCEDWEGVAAQFRLPPGATADEFTQ